MGDVLILLAILRNHELEEFALNEQEVREALIEWETLSSNKENKVLYEARLKFLRDQMTNIIGERKAGREEGRAEGIVEAQSRIGKRMLEEGLSKELITKVTGLTEEEILKL